MPKIEIRGIDVSKWQVGTDWQKVKKAGIKFVMIRAMYGMDTCSLFKQNIDGAVKAGLDVGVYVYSLATTPERAQKEAEQVLKLIKGYPISYPIAYDLENKTQMSLGKDTLCTMVSAFCDTVIKAGYNTVLYSNLNWLRNYLDYNQIKQYDIWLAQYNSKPTYEHPIVMWQSSQTGKVDGVKGNVDLNISYRDYGKEYHDMLAKLTKLQRQNDELTDIVDSQMAKLKALSKEKETYQQAGLRIEGIVKKAQKNGSVSAAQEAAEQILKIIQDLK